MNSYLIREVKKLPPKNAVAAFLSTPKSTQGHGRPFRTIEDYKNDAMRMQSNRTVSKQESFEKITTPTKNNLPSLNQAVR